MMRELIQLWPQSNLIRIFVLLLLAYFLSVSNAFASSDGFDFPVGKPDGTGYGVECCGGLAFLENYDYVGDGVAEFHPGEDWNNDSSGSDFSNDWNDLGDPVYAIADGVVKYARYNSRGWGNLFYIEHTLPNGEKYWSQYGHLASIPDTFSGQEEKLIKRGEILGYIGDYPSGSGRAYHLHFELRKKYRDAPDFVMNWSEEQVLDYYIDPSQFIDANRPLSSEPIKLSASDISYNKATLTWNKPTFSNFDHYELYRSEEQNGTSDPSKRINLLAENETSKNIETINFVDSSLAPNKNYYYALCAFSANGLYVGSEEILVTTTSGIKNITNSPYHQEKPRLSDKYIVWNDNTPDPNSITPLLYAYDIKNDKNLVFNVSSANSTHPRQVEISGSKVVYEANRRFPLRSTQDIYVYDLEANGGLGSGFMVDSTPNASVRYPQIDGNIVVWAELSSSTAEDLYYLDLSKGAEGPMLLAGGPGYQLHPEVWGSKVAYIDTGHISGSKTIMITDIETKQTIPVPQSTVKDFTPLSSPTISDGKVSWVSNEDIYVYDIAKNVTEKISDIKVLSGIVRQGKLIYQAKETGDPIYIRDLATGTTNKVLPKLTYGSSFDFRNNILVYMDKGEKDFYGSGDIFMVHL